MTLRFLTIQRMISFSRSWLHPDEERSIIEQYPIARALLPRMEEAHGNLLVFQRKSLESQGEIAAIQREQALLDAEHDRKVRGVYNYLSSLAELSDGEEEARRYLALRDLLLPDGLQAIIRSYAEEGGEVVFLQQRLTAEAVAALRDIPVPGGTLFDHVEAWMRAGLLLLELDKKRTDIVKTLGQTETKQADVLRARNDWIRNTHALRATLTLDRATPEDMERVFRYLDEAIKKPVRAKGSSVSADEGMIGESDLDELAPEPPSPCAESSDEGSETG